MTAVAASLAGCADKVEEVIVPTDETVEIDVGGTGDDDPIEVVISGGVVSVGDLTGAAYDGTELRVQIVGLDGPDVQQLFDPVAVARMDGFKEFGIQISSLNRDYTALAARSDDDALTAVVVMDGGQFNRFFGGATVQQSSYTAPDSGTASYLGNYASLINGGTASNLTPPVDVNPILFPGGASQVTGTVFLNANFSDSSIEGAIYDRVTNLFGTEYDLADLVLIVGDVNADGTFVSNIELGDGSGLGSYSGALGGTDAANVAGVVALTGDFLVDRAGVKIFGADSDINVDEAVEYGIFVIGACGPLGTDCFPDTLPQP